MIQQFTKEQAVVVSGYTGFLACNFSDFHEDVEKRLGRPVFTHEFASERFTEEIQTLYREDFIAMCHTKTEDK